MAKMVVFWRRLVSVTLAAVGAVIATTYVACAQSENATIVYHGVEFPEALADGQRISTRDYESSNPGLGFSAGYRHRGAISTIYTYDARVTSIPDDIGAAVVIQQFDQAKADIRTRAQFDGIVVSRKNAFVIKDERDRPRLTCEGFELRPRDRALTQDSYVCVGVAREKFLKTRTTMPQSQDSEGEVRRFIGAWVAMLWKS